MYIVTGNSRPGRQVREVRGGQQGQVRADQSESGILSTDQSQGGGSGGVLKLNVAIAGEFSMGGNFGGQNSGQGQ